MEISAALVAYTLTGFAFYAIQLGRRMARSLRRNNMSPRLVRVGVGGYILFSFIAIALYPFLPLIRLLQRRRLAALARPSQCAVCLTINAEGSHTMLAVPNDAHVIVSVLMPPEPGSDHMSIGESHEAGFSLCESCGRDLCQRVGAVPVDIGERMAQLGIPSAPPSRPPDPPRPSPIVRPED